MPSTPEQIKTKAIKCINIYRDLLPYRKDVHLCLTDIHQKVYQIKYVDEYLKFMAIKAVYGNESGTDFSPGSISDNIWHKVLLNTRLYAKLEQICGKRIHHHPQRAKDPANIILKRQLLTKYTIKKHFGDTWFIGTFANFCQKNGKQLTESIRMESRLGC